MSPVPRYRSIHTQTSSLGDHIEVIEQGTLVQLRVNSVWQGEIDKVRAILLPTPYMQQMMLSLCYAQSLRRFLTIGLGAGCIPKALHALFPTARIDAVEIDPDIVFVASEFFGVPSAKADREDEGGITVHTQDGFEFIEQPPVTYDVIFVDAFAGSDLPPILRSRRTRWHLKRALAPGGVLAINLSRLDPLAFCDIVANVRAMIHPPTLFDPKNEERHDELNIILLSPAIHNSRLIRKRRLFLELHTDLLGMDVNSLLKNRCR